MAKWDFVSVHEFLHKFKEFLTYQNIFRSQVAVLNVQVVVFHSLTKPQICNLNQVSVANHYYRLGETYSMM